MNFVYCLVKKRISSINKALLILAACLVFQTTSSLAAGNLADAEIISKSGGWKVARTVDSMTDKVSCTGLYKNRLDIQLNLDRLYINMQGKGGVHSYTTRVDSDEPIRHIPNMPEKNLSLIIIGGETAEDKQLFARVIQSNRLRVRVLTLLMTSEDYDIDLTGLADAYAVIAGDSCGLGGSTSRPEQAKTNAPNSTTEIPPDVAVIIKKTETLNDQCLGGSGDNPETMKVCDSREKHLDLLRQKGWCWGDDSQIGADKTWKSCL